MNLALTHRQREIAAAVTTFFLDHGRLPTVRELANAIHCRSTSTVHAHLRALVRKGVLSSEHGRIAFSRDTLAALLAAPPSATVERDRPAAAAGPAPR